MSDDLVERLRRNPRGVAFEFEHQVADEIERLRAENKALKEPAYEIDGTAIEEILRLRAELAEVHQREELFWTPLLKHTEKVEAKCDAIRELLRDAREACLRWLSNGAPRSIPVRENDADVLLAAIDAALAQEKKG